MQVYLGPIIVANASEAMITNGFAHSKSMHLIFVHIFVNLLFHRGIGTGCDERSVIKDNVYGASLPHTLLNGYDLLCWRLVTEYVKEMCRCLCPIVLSMEIQMDCGYLRGALELWVITARNAHS